MKRVVQKDTKMADMMVDNLVDSKVAPLGLKMAALKDSQTVDKMVSETVVIGVVDSVASTVL